MTGSVAFGAVLRRHRLAAGLTQEELAEQAGMSVRAISDIERGVITQPHRSTLELLVEALTLTSDDRTRFLAAARRPREPAEAAPVVEATERVWERPLPIGGFLGALPAGPLVAREAELNQVLSAVDAVARGNGRLVFLTGEPGIGKTRLAQEVTLQVRHRRFLVASGRCYEPQKAVPFYPFLEGLGTLYAAAPASIRADAPQRWPYLFRLLPNLHLPMAATSGEGREEQERLFWSVTGFVQAVAEEVAFALLLDDLHWADSTSLALLQHLARHTRTDRVLLLGTYTDVESGQPGTPLERALRDLGREQLAERVAIRRLGQDGTAALIATTFEEDEVSAEFSELVYRQTEGNPFFIQEVLRALVERGDVYREEGRWQRREVGDVEVPESIRSAIRERVSRLSEDAQAILQEASVLGQTFEFDWLQGIGERKEDALEAALETARAAGLLRPARKDGYAFNHALTQQTLYAELPPRRRRKLHLAAGEALERLARAEREKRAADLAWHFQEGGDAQRAMTYSMLAGDQAEAVFAHAEAERHYRTALALAQDSEAISRDVEALEKLGGVLKNLGRYNEALDVLERAADMYRQVNDREAVARLSAQIGRAHADRGTCDEGIAHVETALRAMDTADPSSGLAALYAALAYLFFYSGRYLELQTAAERAAELARLVGDDQTLSSALLRRASAMSMLGRGEEALPVIQDVIPLAERIGDLATLQRAFVWLSNLHRVRGQLDQAIAYRARALDVANRLGDPSLIAFSLATLGRVYFLRGDWEEANTRIERAAKMAAATEPSWYDAFTFLHFGELRLAQGAWEEASRFLKAGADIGRRNNDVQALRMAHQALAELDLLQGRPEAARARLEPLLDRPALVELDVTMLLPVQAQAELALGDVERAERILAEVMDRAATQDIQLAMVDALRVRGALLSEQRRWSDAEQAFEEGLSLAQRIQYPYAEMRLFYDCGLMHLKRGAPLQARERLQQALILSRRLGAQPYTERADKALRDLA